jgi:hypothetical protein
MFLTTESTRVQSVLPRGMHMWTAVEIELMLPLLIVSISHRETPTELPLARTFVVLPDDLTALCASPKFILEQVDLLSPAHINGSGRWMLEPLRELWKCSEPHSKGTVAWLFQVSNRTYADSRLCTPADELRRDLCVFDAQMLDSSTPAAT